MELRTAQEIGGEVERLLRERSLLKRDFAAALEIDPSGVSRILSGEREMSAIELALAADFLNVTAEQLLRADTEALAWRVDNADSGDPNIVQAIQLFDEVLADLLAAEAAAR